MGPALAFLGAVFFGTGLATASLAYVVAVNLARIAILSLISKALAPKIDLSQAAADKLLTVRSSVQPQAFVYGQDMLSGPLLFANTGGEGNNDLHRLVALTGREIDSFVAFRIDDTDIVIGTHITGDSGLVTGGPFADVVEIDTRRGTSTQTAIANLLSEFPDNWTTDHTGRSWSLFYTKMSLVANNEAFEGGIPQNLRALIKGSKVYDPREAHDIEDHETWEWTENPALCLADFMRWGRIGYGESHERIDWDLVAAAADICDELVTVPSGTQKRYTCNFTFYADQSRETVREILETAMLGRMVFSQGKWRMFAGAPIAATVTLSEANLSGSLQFQASTPSENRYNRINGKFVDPTRNYTANPYPEQRDSTYEDADNEVKYQTFDQNACNNSYEAQRNAIIRLRKSRMQRVVNFQGNWSCFRVQPGTTVNLDCEELGLSGEKYFVTEWTLDKEGKGVNLVMVQEDDSVWDDPEDYVTRTSTGDLVFNDQAAGLTNAELHNERINATCYSGIVVGADGRLYYLNAAGVPTQTGVPEGEWRGSELGDRWVRCTVNFGTLDVGTADTWQFLDVDREFSCNRPTAGTDLLNITIEIADDDAGTNIISSATFDISATYITPLAYELVEAGNWASNSGSSSGSVALDLPARTAGNQLIVYYTGLAQDLSAPAGWTQFHDNAFLTTSHAKLFSRIATNDSNDDFTLSWSTGNPCAAQMASFTDPASVTNPVAQNAGGSLQEGTVASAPYFPYLQFTSATTGSWLYLLIAVRYQTTTGTAPGWTQVTDDAQLDAIGNLAFMNTVTTNKRSWAVYWAWKSVPTGSGLTFTAGELTCDGTHAISSHINSQILRLVGT